MMATGWFDTTLDWFGETMREIGAIDGMCLVLLVIFAVRGFFKGFLRQAALIVGVVLGATLSRAFATDLADAIPRVTARIEGANAVFVAYFLIFVGTFVALGIIVRILRKTLEAYRLQSLDGFLGLASGVVVGGLIVSMGLVAALMFTPRIGPGEAIHNQIRQSRALGVVAHAMPHLGEIFPSEFVVRGQEILAAHDEGKKIQEDGPKTAPPQPRSEDPFDAPERQLDELERMLLRPDSGALRSMEDVGTRPAAVPSERVEGELPDPRRKR